jgi:hypothetical protein
MAIAFDSATAYTYNSGRTVTQNHTTSGSDRIAFVHVTVGNLAATVSSATYGGNAMTEVGSAIDNVSGGVRTYLYYYLNPPTSSTTISVSSTGGNPGIVISTVSYTGVDQTTPIDNSNAVAVNSNLTTFTGTLTVNTADSWLIYTFRTGNGFAMTASGGSVVRNQPENVALGAGCIIDSNSALATGSRSVSATCSSQFCGGTVIASIKPAAGGGGAPTPTLMMMGVGT